MVLNIDIVRHLTSGLILLLLYRVGNRLTLSDSDSYEFLVFK